MHPGNIFVNNSNPENPTYVAVDYAICGSLTEKEQLIIGKMLSEMFNKNYSGVAKTMINADWVGEDTKEVELEVVIRNGFGSNFRENPSMKLNLEKCCFIYSTLLENLNYPCRLHCYCSTKP